MTAPVFRFASSLSTETSTEKALADVSSGVRTLLDGSRADLSFLFFSPHHAEEIAASISRLRADLGGGLLIGCAGESIVGTGREVEGMPAVSLWSASLPGARLDPFHLDYARTSDGGSFLGWPDDFLDSWPEPSGLLMLADPFTFPADQLAERLNEDRPGVSLLGGMASGASRPGQNPLLLDDAVHARGAVGVRISGAAKLQAVVSQGCRPIGKPFVVTKAERTVVEELGGKPALARLQEVFDALSPADKRLFQQGLHVGRAMSEYKDEFGRGDFLIRNVLGVEPESGAVVLGDQVRVGQTVQFHVRDAASADEDLRELLASGGGAPAGALLFTCNGRGERMFAAPNHDAGAIKNAWGEFPLAGFFAQGELGPVGGRNFLHGFTAAIAVFRPAE
ncbi:MAG TPA: FIST N-terminal domain-containing protein [Planctomycetia bacterium]|nr:FIST N-terminal domain-containing protein [Planctomycetia bacterium]